MSKENGTYKDIFILGLMLEGDGNLLPLASRGSYQQHPSIVLLISWHSADSISQPQCWAAHIDSNCALALCQLLLHPLLPLLLTK